MYLNQPHIDFDLINFWVGQHIHQVSELQITNCKIYDFKFSMIKEMKVENSFVTFLQIIFAWRLVINVYLWRYGLWSFQTGDTKLKRFLPKTQHTKRKWLNFEFWINGELSKSAKIWLSKSIFYVKNHPNLYQIFFIEEYQFRNTIFFIDIFR